MRDRFELSRWLGVLAWWVGGLGPGFDAHAQSLEQLVSISEFAVEGRPGATHLERLLSARDPWVRAGAAVSLALEDPTRGLPALESAMKIPGMPGAWAGLALASRAKKEGVDRALELLRPIEEMDRRSRLRASFAGRLIVLLSISAHASGIPFPVKRKLVRDSFEFDERTLEAELLPW